VFPNKIGSLLNPSNLRLRNRSFKRIKARPVSGKTCASTICGLET
jgi:hypothetical protein